jgi:hypothetical protein
MQNIGAVRVFERSPIGRERHSFFQLLDAEVLGLPGPGIHAMNESDQLFEVDRATYSSFVPAVFTNTVATFRNQDPRVTESAPRS